MKLSAYVCSNWSEIEKAEKQSEDMNLMVETPAPEYNKSKFWLHIDSITRAGTRTLEDGTEYIAAFLDDGSSVMLERTTALEEALDERFKDEDQV